MVMTGNLNAGTGIGWLRIGSRGRLLWAQ